MRKIKWLSVFMCMLLSLLALFSCKIGDNGDGVNIETPVDENIIWSPDETLNIVVPADSDVDASQLSYELNERSIYNTVVSASSAASSHEIVIGNTSREISEKAYRRLDRLLNDDEAMSGWVVYSLNGSLCIAYESGYAFNEAVGYIISNLAISSTLSLGDGIVGQESFNLISYIDEKRNEEREVVFSKLEKSLGANAANEIRDLYNLYGIDTYVWIANLWDPTIGGFYYSNSGRDSEGFLPDLESTWQAVRHLQNRGMFVDYGNDMAQGLPEEIKTALISFTKGLQSSKDGYFYHPQWKSVGDTRRGRDLSWATNLLSALGDKPLYDTPSGVSGTLGAPGASAASLTGTLAGSTATAVSKVVSTASNLPSYLKSLDAWAEYIDELKFSENSYSAGNKINAIYTQIRNAGAKYVDYLINYLNEHQNPDTGLWEDGVTYQGINGLMKISSTYTSLDRSMPNYEAALNSAMKIALKTEFDAGQKHMCSVYNPWVAMANVLSAARNAEGTAKREQLRQMVIARADELIAITHDKLAIFHKTDGGFSYHEDYSASASQGALVALPNSAEGDMNATTISCSTISTMLGVFGVDTPPFYTSVDYEYFTELLLSMGEIIKDEEEVRATETVTFDSYNPDFGEEVNGVVMTPADGVTTKIYDTELGADGYKWTRSAVVKNPVPGADSKDLVFKVNTYLDMASETKQNASGVSYNRYAFGTTKPGATYIFDFDLLAVKDDNTILNSNTLIQLFLENATFGDKLFALNIVHYMVGSQSYLRIGEQNAGADGKRDTQIVSAIPVNEWVNLRIECYKIYDEEGSLTVKAKVFVNGEYGGECDSGYLDDDGKYIDAQVDVARLNYYRSNQAEFYFNNVLAEITNTEYVHEQASKPTVPAGGTPATFERFDIAAGGNVLNPDHNIKNRADESMTYEVAVDPTGAENQVMKVTSSGEGSGTLYSYLELQNESEDSTLYAFESDIYIDSESASTSTALYLGFSNSSRSTPLSELRLQLTSGDKINLLSGNKVPGTGNLLAENIASADEWFKIRIELTYTGSEKALVKVYVNGKLAVAETEIYNPEQVEGYEIATFRIRYNATKKMYMYFDNMLLVRTATAFVPTETPELPDEEPDTPDSAPTTSGTVSFDSFVEGTDDVYKPVEHFVNVQDSFGTTYSIAQDPKDAANKVLSVVTAGGATKSDILHSYTYLTVEDSISNHYVFESRIYISQDADNASRLIYFGFDNGDTTSGNALTEIILRKQSDGTIDIIEDCSVPSTTGEIVADAAKVDEWFTLRIELDCNEISSTRGESDVPVTIFINGIEVWSGQLYYNVNYNSTFGSIEKFRIRYSYNSVVNAYFDDISFVQGGVTTGQ